MKERTDLCRLDYLLGTLATAYKGVITALVMKDFCITEGDGSTIVQGSILAMPDGEYYAHLMHEGKEFSKSLIKEGSFALTAGTNRTEKAKNLQIDIVQSGRHIGTFLLKKETSGGAFSSALELSRDLTGINFKALTAPLAGAVGLLRRAEDILAKLLSTKKDWPAFSEEINGFSNDLFWHDRQAYSRWYELLVDYSVKAGVQVDLTVWDKAITNVLSLIELPLDQEAEPERLRFFVDTWLRVVNSSPFDLTYRLRHAAQVLAGIFEKVPQSDLAPTLRSLFAFLRERIKLAPTVSPSVLDLTKAALSRSDHDLLSRFGEEQKAKLQQDIVDCGMLIDQGDYAAIFERIRDRDAWHLDDVQFVEDFFDRIVRAATRESADDLARAVFDMLPFFGSVSPRAYELVTEKTSVLMNRVIALGRADIAETLLQSIAEGPQAVRDDLLLNPGTAQSIIASGSNNLLSRYVSLVKKIIIPAPNVSGFSRESWAEILNPLHGARISKFLAILGHSRGELREILVQVVGNLYVTGVLIPDDKLFQRDISAYLNSPARENDFLLNYLLLKKFPVYFNEVGATGRIRDDTTEIDSWGNDPILYFLRKQVHVNASNYNIQLIEKIITTWTFNSPEFLEGAVPEDVLTDVNGELLGQYAAVAKPLFTSLGILDNEGLHLDHILDAQEDALRREAARMSGTEEVKAKVLLLCRIYQEVSKKYSFGGHDEQADDPFSTFAGHLETVKRMKSTILSSEKTDPEESLYFKRHIAFGIPSVLGSYHERKFDALGEAFRQETYIRTLMENMITTISRTGERSSGAACKKWVQSLGMVNDLFSLHGLDNFQADELIAVFRANNLHCSQIIDLLRIWQGEMTWMVESLHGMFHHPIVDVLQALPAQDLPDRLKNLDDGEGNFINKAADVVMRDLVSSIAGLTELDRLLDRLITTLTDGMQVASDEQIMFSEGAGKAREYVTLDELHDDDVSRLAPLLGGKAKNLMYLSNRNLPVPPGVVFTADHTPGYREYTAADRFLPVLKKAIGTIEKRSGTRFGNKENPLFLSVRSGSYISMPGILSSILYCGMNRETLAGFISTKNDPWLGWDSYRRFIEHYATVVLDLDITVFEAIAAQVRKGSGKGDGDALSAQELENMVSQYLQEVSRLGADIPDDPYEQLRQSVTAIYRSWYSDRARQFRAAMGVSEHWGTAVTIMQMVSGNAQGSGASVFFTRDPFSHQKGVTGDTGETATGDDLVYGRLTHRRLRRGQAGSPGKSLEEIDPVLFRMHEELGEEVEKAMRGLSQEVEATYTTGPDGKRVISVLQTRRMEFHREFTKKFHDVCRMEENVITRGVGVHGGVLSGVATLSSRPEQIKTLRKENNLPVILLRTTASTDDVSLMPYIDGIVTAAGGPTSHASLLAQKFDLTAVVGCSNMHIGPGTGGQLSARIGDETITEGMLISIDGTTGLVYTGTCFLTVEKPPEEQASRRSVE